MYQLPYEGNLRRFSLGLSKLESLGHKKTLRKVWDPLSSLVKRGLLFEGEFQDDQLLQMME